MKSTPGASRFAGSKAKTLRPQDQFEQMGGDKAFATAAATLVRISTFLVRKWKGPVQLNTEKDERQRGQAKWLLLERREGIRETGGIGGQKKALT